MKKEIRLAYPYLSVRIEKEELAENYIYTLLFTVDTILSELGIEEITEENIGEVIKLLRLPLFHIREIKEFLDGKKNFSKKEKREGEGTEEEETGGEKSEEVEEEAEEGLFLMKPTYATIFEYPFVDEEERMASEASKKLISLILEYAQSLPD